MSIVTDMTTEKAVTMLLKMAAKSIQKSELTIVDLIAYVSSRPFNMKGQEFEEIIGFMLNKEFSELDNQAIIKTQSDKQSKDLIFSYCNQDFPFSIKNYTISRFQISTYASDMALCYYNA